jgi:hypothetical protein
MQDLMGLNMTKVKIWGQFARGFQVRLVSELSVIVQAFRYETLKEPRCLGRASFCCRYPAHIVVDGQASKVYFVSWPCLKNLGTSSNCQVGLLEISCFVPGALETGIRANRRAGCLEESAWRRMLV